MKTTLSMILVAFALGCGGAEKQSTMPESPAQPAAAKMAAPTEIDAFHEVIGPRWHAEPGEARKTETCGAIADFKAKAAAITAKWSDAGAKLEASIVALEGTCAGTDVAAFDAAFKTVHEDFHATMEAAGMHHDEAAHEHGPDGEHKHPGHGDDVTGDD